MIFTHRDDVADQAKWAKAIACERWIHKDDLDAGPEVEKQITGIDEISIRENLKLIPTPGHTKGSIVAILGNQNCIIFNFQFTVYYLSFHCILLHVVIITIYS